MKNHFIAIVIAFMFIVSPFVTTGGSGSDVPDAAASTSGEAATDLSNGWTHRPIVEHFTGLSCGPCMNSAHPDLTRLWEESGYTDEQPWNYIEWHEYNGGGEDALATEDTRERMRFYQPEVSGTPNADIDGGYVEAGGSHQTNGCDYDTVKQALEESGSRDENDMKMVDIEVHNSFDAANNRFIIDVTVTYISDQSTGDPFHDPRLNGHLYVFMLEDNVTAWSKTLGEYTLCHNVFREYAIEDEEFSILQSGFSQDFHVEWTIPDTMISDPDDDGNYEEIPIQVPINPLNVYPLVAVYDEDDRSSGTENDNKDGDGHRGSPRALQSATPKTTAYDNGNEKPGIKLPTPELNDYEFVVKAELSDDGGEPDNGYLVWRNTQEANNTMEHWEIVEMEKDGDQWTGSIPVNETSELTYGVMTFDSDGASSITDKHYYPTETASPEKTDDDEFPWEYYASAGAASLAVIGLVVLPGVSRNKKDDGASEVAATGNKKDAVPETENLGEPDAEAEYVPDA